MTTTEVVPHAVLFERDETAWLDVMSRIVAEGRYSELDAPNLSEYLADMAKRDRREVESRLVTLLTLLLKWEFQPDHRSRSWQGTIAEQRRELRKLLDSGTLYNHAQSHLMDAFEDGRKQASIETGLSRETFPTECEWNLDQLIADDDLG